MTGIDSVIQRLQKTIQSAVANLIEGKTTTQRLNNLKIWTHA